MNKIIIVGLMFLLLVSSVSAQFIFKNDELESLNIGTIITGFLEYKEQLKIDKCLDKDDKFILKEKEKEHPCIDKFYYLNSYFTVYEVLL